MANGGGTGGDGGRVFCRKTLAGYFAGGPLPPSGRAAGLAAYKRPAAQPPALILLSSIPVKKKEERGGEEKKGRSPAGFRRRFQVIFIDPICDY